MFGKSRIDKFSFFGLVAITLMALLVGASGAVTVEEALQHVPVQKDVDYDRPTAKEIPDCTVKSEEMGGVSAWVVRGPQGEILRCFTDTNNDNRVDQWRYYTNGIESYRDMDANYNGKADQCRWLGLSGMRWGIDPDEDGQIDSWKMISPEEVTLEIVGSIRDKDVARFATVLITPEELAGLGLSPQSEKKMAQQIATATKRFQRALTSQRVVDARAKWVHFSASKPGAIPAGTNGNTRDIVAYENVAAMLEKGQVSIGTLIKVGEQWRAIDIPISLMDEEDQISASLFLTPNVMPEPPLDNNEISEETRQMVAEIDEIDKSLAAASPQEKPKLYDRQAALLRELASKAKTQSDQAVWVRQLAETLGAAVQSGHYPEGVGKLEKLHGELAAQSKESELTAFVRFRHLTADYSMRLQDPDTKNFAKIQDWWLEQLDSFVTDYPEGKDATEAMLQLAIAEEFAGNETPALKWYDRIIRQGASGIEIEKAKGARARLTADGQPLVFGGRLVDGKSIDLRQLDGKVVLIHYWATWCDQCLEDMELIARMVSKYGKQFVPIGVNLDTEERELAAFLRKNRLPWPQIYEKGGLDSRPAIELGIVTVPTMVFVNSDGEVVTHNFPITELESLIQDNVD